MKVVTDFSVIANDPLFDKNAACTLDNFDALVFEYRLPEIHSCQFMEHGAKQLCNQEHNHGWYMQTKEGARTCVGFDCGDTKLEASTKYQLDKRRIEIAQTETHCIERLDDIVANRLATAARLDSINVRLKACRDKLNRLQLRVPKGVADAVGRLSLGRAHVNVKIIDERTDSKGNKSVTYIPFSLGVVQGIRVFAQPSRVTRLEGSAFAIREALGQAVPDTSQGIRRMQRWIKQIDNLPKLDSEVSEVEAEIAAYATPNNLQLQIFLTNNWPDQIRMASVAIEYAGNTISTKDPEQLIRDYSEQIRAANRGRDFKV